MPFVRSILLLPLLASLYGDAPLTVDTAPKAAWTNPSGTAPLFSKGRDFVKEPFRLAIVLIEFPDAKHDPVHSPQLYQTFYFADRTYRRTPNGDSSPGSVADFYSEQSHGTFKLTGRAFDWVTIPTEKTFFDGKKAGNREAREKLQIAAMDAVKTRDGASSFDGFDAVSFVYAGSMKGAHQGDILWAHRSSLSRPRVSYLFTSEIEKINVACHEFGHILGLPDLYEKKDKDGKVVREGLGSWTTMASGYRGEKPRHIDCWCKMRLGWLNPTAIDPGTERALSLRPIESHPQDCFVIASGPDEFYMLENRQSIGFDEGIAPGLYICRCTVKRNSAGRPSTTLHLMGPRDTSTGPLSARRRVVWPDGSRDSFDGPGFRIAGIHADGESLTFTLSKR